MGPRAGRKASLTDGSWFVKARSGQSLHLLYNILHAQQGTLATQKRQGLKEPGAHGTTGRDEAQRVDQVPCPLLFLGGETSDGLLDAFLRPLRQGPQPFEKFRERLPDE